MSDTPRTDECPKSIGFLHNLCGKLERENAQLRAVLRYGQCAYCLKKFEVGSEVMRQTLLDHVASCEKNPIHELRAELDNLKKFCGTDNLYKWCEDKSAGLLKTQAELAHAKAATTAESLDILSENIRLKSELDKANAACAELKETAENLRTFAVEYPGIIDVPDSIWMPFIKALSTTCGQGYLSPEQVKEKCKPLVEAIKQLRAEPHSTVAEDLIEKALAHAEKENLA